MHSARVAPAARPRPALAPKRYKTTEFLKSFRFLVRFFVWGDALWLPPSPAHAPSAQRHFPRTGLGENRFSAPEHRNHREPVIRSDRSQKNQRIAILQVGQFDLRRPVEHL